MNRHLPLPPCPPGKNWEICDPAFDPESLWNFESLRLVKEEAKRKVFCCKGYYIKAFKLGYSAISLFRDPARKEWKIATRLRVSAAIQLRPRHMAEVVARAILQRLKLKALILNHFFPRSGQG